MDTDLLLEDQLFEHDGKRDFVSKADVCNLFDLPHTTRYMWYHLPLIIQYCYYFVCAIVWYIYIYNYRPNMYTYIVNFLAMVL